MKLYCVNKIHAINIKMLEFTHTPYKFVLVCDMHFLKYTGRKMCTLYRSQCMLTGTRHQTNSDSSTTANI
jgi:hypothetical protein